MNIEESLLIKGGKEISDRFLNFINSIVVKNQQEADSNESQISYNNYIKYVKCINGISSFNDHVFFEVTDPLFPSILRNISNIERDKFVRDNNTDAVKYIKLLRKTFIENYFDSNPYYSTMSGLPKDSSEFLEVINRDNVNFKKIDVMADVKNFDKYNGLKTNISLYDLNYNDYPKTFLYYNESNIRKRINQLNDNEKFEIYKVFIHKITPDRVDLKLTYKAIFIDGYLNEIVKRYNDTHPYLKYMDRKYSIDIENLREAEQFDILWVDKNILTGDELDYFYESYNTVKDFILEHKYMKNLGDVYDNYSNFQILVILFGTFQKMCSTYIDRYTVRNYTDKDIYDILDSNNLSCLNKVSISILRNVVENLDSLLSVRGTVDILYKLINMVSKDQTISLRKYSIVKKFRTNVDGRTELDTNLSFDDPKNVDLVFVDNTISSTSDKINVIDSEKRHVPYEDFVLNDPTWAANGLYPSEEARRTAIRKVKRKILQMKFNKMDTKYFGITSVLEVYKVFTRIYFKIGMIIQHYDGMSGINDIDVKFDTVDITPFDILNMSVYGYRFANYLKDKLYINYDLPDSNCWSYPNTMRLNTMNVNETIDVLKNLTFEVINYGTGHDNYFMKVSDVFKTKEDIDLFVRPFIYTFSNTFNFENIMKQFDNCFKIYQALGDKSMESGDYITISAYKAMYKWFTVTVDNDTDYDKGYISLSSYLKTTYPTLFEVFNLLGKKINDLNSEIKFITDKPISELNDNEKALLITPLKLNIEKCIIDILQYSRRCLKAFNTSIEKIIHEEGNSDFDISIKNSLDLTTLVNSFASIYVELRDVDVNIDLSDDPDNRYQLLDRSFTDTFSKFQEYIERTYLIGVREFCNFEDIFTFGEYLEMLEISKDYEKFLYTSRYSIIHIDNIRSRYEFGSVYGFEYIYSTDKSLKPIKSFNDLSELKLSNHWDDLYCYRKYNSVSYNDEIYTSISDNNIDNHPDTSPLFWEVYKEDLREIININDEFKIEEL